MKKTLSCFLVVMFLFTLVLSGCGTSNTQPDSSVAVSSSSEPSDSTAAGNSTAEPAVNAPKGKISFMCWYNENQFAPILDAFKAKYPDVEMDFQNTPTENNQFNQKLTLLANSGELPDIFYNSMSVRTDAKYGYFADLTDFDVVKRLPDAYKNVNSAEGKVYAFAPDNWIASLYYNKAIFTKYGLSEPKTYADFLTLCKTLQAQGIKPISMASGELPDLIYLLHNSEVLSKDMAFDDKINTGETKFSDGYLGALNMWNNDMVKTGIISKDMAGMSDDQRFDEFTTGKAAMTISGPWALSTFRQKNPDLDFAIMPFPGTSGDLWTLGCPNVGISISAKTSNMDAAKALLDFIGSDEGLALYQKITNNFIGVKGIEYELDPVLEPMRQYAESGKFAFPVANWNNSSVIAQMVEKGMQGIVLGATTPDKLVQDVDAKVADLIKQ
jgi:raffinose/stachyose/melibiose transport system substrate-binding protein